MLDVHSTERLFFSCETNDELEQRYKRIDAVYPPLPSISLNLTLEERIRVIEEHIALINHISEFIAEMICPKEIDGWQKMIVYAFDKCGLPVGRTAINYSNTSRPSIDIKVAPAKQRQGYGYEMLQAVVAAAFEQCDYDHLEYDLHASNEASRKLIQKLGGQLTFKDHRGECYSIGREEFMKRI